MAAKKPQTYANHRKFVPSYHFLTFGILLINALWSIWRLYKTPGIDAALGLAVAVALILMCLHLRLFPLVVQDRVIRLEERLRLHEILPEEQRARIPELGPKQFVALRFASDEELPDLVQEVLAGQHASDDSIKKRIRNWRADHLRL